MTAVLLAGRRRAWCAAAVLAMVAIATAGCVPAAGGGADGDILTMVNDARAANGLGPLTPCGRLDATAYAHANDMWANNFNSHTGSDGSSVGDRAHRQGYAWTTVGENIAWGFERATSTFDAWMRSTAHRSNILHPAFVHHGWAHVGDRWVQVFGAGAC